MQIVANTTRMRAEVAFAADVDARDHCIVVVKGTFKAGTHGELILEDEQMPFFATDEHYGDPATTCVRYECDFALAKLRTDVIVVGKAITPTDRPVRTLAVRLEVNGRNKELVVHGERRWVGGGGTLMPSEPAAFTEIPVTFDRAWGGLDDARGPDRVEVEARNPVGVGFHPHRRGADVVGLPVPNIEPRARPISSPRERHEPVGFGCIGRGWQPRLALAGTYDTRWREERAPYLPADFDVGYFQCAPPDQQFPRFRGGERIRCVHMAREGAVDYVIPTLSVPVRFRFHDGDVERRAALDTVTLEPHLGRAMLVWRASAPMRNKPTALREILVGEQPAFGREGHIGYRDGKPVFAGLAATVAWLRARRGGRS